MIARHIAILTLLVNCEAAKILAFFPILTRSGDFYPLIKELAKRGHDVYFITANPLHPADKTAGVLKEINLEHLCNDFFKKYSNVTLNYEDMYENETRTHLLLLFEQQMQSNQIQQLIMNHKTFDLLLLTNFRPAMIWSHIYKAPVIKLQTGLGVGDSGNFGAPTHPIYFPDISSKRIYNLSTYEMFTELYNMYYRKKVFVESEDRENEVMRKIFGPDVPVLSDLEKNTEMLFLRSNNFWERNRPLSKNVVYFGYIDQIPTRNLPQDIKTFLDSSDGAIYVNVCNKVISTDMIQIFLDVFSELPDNVLWKSDAEASSHIPKNVMIRKWFPESDILWHPNVKLIITQGDLQTTIEAIEAGIPLIGLRGGKYQMVFVEHYVEYGIGCHLDLNSIKKEEFRSSIVEVCEDPRYRDNILRLRTLILDTKSPALDTAILWIEYVLKHSTAHLRSPASNLTCYEYFEIELIMFIISIITIVLISVWFILKMVLKKFEAILAYQTTTDNV